MASEAEKNRAVDLSAELIVKMLRVENIPPDAVIYGLITAAGVTATQEGHVDYLRDLLDTAAEYFDDDAFD